MEPNFKPLYLRNGYREPYQYGALYLLNRPCCIDWDRLEDARMKYKGVSVLRYEIGAGEICKGGKWIKKTIPDWDGKLGLGRGKGEK